jgi:alpha-glucosidase (family GH31 glycosyl hydrolase)
LLSPNREILEDVIDRVPLKPQSFMLSAHFASDYLYGLPERSAKFLLEDTLNWKGHGYRLYSLDVFPHEEWDTRALYSGIPYITCHSTDSDASLFSTNPSETYVDIFPHPKSRGKLVTFT